MGPIIGKQQYQTGEIKSGNNKPSRPPVPYRVFSRCLPQLYIQKARDKNYGVYFSAQKIGEQSHKKWQIIPKKWRRLNTRFTRFLDVCCQPAATLYTLRTYCCMLSYQTNCIYIINIPTDSIIISIKKHCLFHKSIISIFEKTRVIDGGGGVILFGGRGESL